MAAKDKKLYEQKVKEWKNEQAEKYEHDTNKLNAMAVTGVEHESNIEDNENIISSHSDPFEKFLLIKLASQTEQDLGISDNSMTMMENSTLPPSNLKQDDI
eukprot:616910-Ditylum_brightwellii.AAC.1